MMKRPKIQFAAVTCNFIPLIQISLAVLSKTLIHPLPTRVALTMAYLQLGSYTLFAPSQCKALITQTSYSQEYGKHIRKPPSEKRSFAHTEYTTLREGRKVKLHSFHKLAVDEEKEQFVVRDNFTPCRSIHCRSEYTQPMCRRWWSEKSYPLPQTWHQTCS
jgi:hypothetical protein